MHVLRRLIIIYCCGIVDMFRLGITGSLHQVGNMLESVNIQENF